MVVIGRKHICIVALTVLAVFVILCLWLLALGMPLHDFNLVRLQQRYENIAHPAGTVSLRKMTYLGGPDEHGSQTCVYAVGELRRSSIPRDVVKMAYEKSAGINRGNVPLQIFFAHTGPLLLTSPLYDWLIELEEAKDASAGTVYLVYDAQEVPFWGDYRCDD